MKQSIIKIVEEVKSKKRLKFVNHSEYAENQFLIVTENKAKETSEAIVKISADIDKDVMINLVDENIVQVQLTEQTKLKTAFNDVEVEVQANSLIEE